MIYESLARDDSNHDGWVYMFSIAVYLKIVRDACCVVLTVSSALIRNYLRDIFFQGGYYGIVSQAHT
jgi:hypothetical protein